MDIVTGTAANTISSAIVVPLIREIDSVIHLDDNRKLLEEQLNRMKDLLLDIRSQFQHQQREVPDSLKNCLLRMQRKVGEARELIHLSQRPWLQQCIDCVLCNPKVFTQIREWNTTIRDLHDQLRNDFSVICSAQLIASTAPQEAQLIASAAPQEAGVLLQDQPDTGLVGLQFKDAESQLVRWLTDSSLVHIHTIGVYVMGGVGKTTLLKKVHNTVQVSHIFYHVIWVTVAQFPIQQIQQDIASAINLDLANYSTDARKMKLSAHLKTKNFFLILDDMWSGLNLKELGVEFGTDNKGSKVVFSTRNRDLIGEMNAEEFMEIRQLPTEEAWDLFCRVAAFQDGHVPEDMEQIARKVANECKGLPLAITVIASTMKSKRAINDWKFALRQMQKVDLSFPITHPRIDRDLYQRLRWSYEALSSADLKNCFLYCALFSEDAIIGEEDLVQMWVSEGLIKTSDGDYDYLLDTGRIYLKLLLDRCLLNEAIYANFITVHDVIRDMGIYIGEKEENYACRAGQRLQHFPDMEALADCKRLSVRDNNITSLPTKEFTCPNLVSLLLGNNRELRTIPEGFFLNFTSLKLLQLDFIPIKSLPTSLWQLIHLEYLDLSCTNIENIPSDIGNLVHLKFLSLVGCSDLMSLPSEIGKLTNLKYLDIRNTPKLMPFPHDIKVLLKCKIVDDARTPECGVVSLGDDEATGENTELCEDHTNIM